MTQQEREDPGLTEMILDAEPEAQDEPQKQPNKAEPTAHRQPPEGEDELPLTGQ